MKQDPSSDSNPPPSIEPRGMFSGLEWRAIVLGAVADIVATVLASIIFVFILIAVKGEQGQEFSEEALREMLAAPEIQMAWLLIGLGCSVLGGYIAGRLAKREEVKHGALAGFLSVVLGVLMEMASGVRAASSTDEVTTYLVTVAAGALGGYIAMRLAGPRPRENEEMRSAS